MLGEVYPRLFVFLHHFVSQFMIAFQEASIEHERAADAVRPEFPGIGQDTAGAEDNGFCAKRFGDAVAGNLPLSKSCRHFRR